MTTDRAHFSVHFREHSPGSVQGPSGAFHTENLNLRGDFRGHLRIRSRVHFHDHSRERVRGSNFAVRVLCAFLSFGPAWGVPVLSGPVRDTPPYRARPCRDSIAEEVSHPFALFS